MGDHFEIALQRILAPILVLGFLVAPPALAWIKPDVVDADTYDFGRLFGWLICFLSLSALVVLVGRIATGQWIGILIDDRNRISLSRFQLALWTSLIIATIYSCLISNAVHASTILTDAMNIDLDWNLIGLLGISVGSFVSSPLVLQAKTSQDADPTVLAQASNALSDSQHLSGNVASRGTLLTKSSTADARWADLIKGEDVGNATSVDITRLQLLLITLVVYIAYASVAGKALFLEGSLLNSIPKMNTTLLGLVLVSHAGYIGGKIVPSSATSQSGAFSQLSQAMLLSQRATEFVRDGQARLARTSDPTLRLLLQRALDQARSVAAEAATLPGQISNGTLTDPNALSRLDAILTTLGASLSSADDTSGSSASMTAPAAATVADVQRRLTAQFPNVQATGIVDSVTESAVTKVLTGMGLAREEMTQNPFRFYEELATILP